MTQATDSIWTAAELRDLSIHALARIVRQDWGPKINFAAKPYLDAMSTMEKIDDSYGLDDGRGIVAYFLGNATSWRGATARLVKAELNRRLGR